MVFEIPTRPFVASRPRARLLCSLLCALGVLVSLLTTSASALAQGTQDYQKARVLYEKGDHAGALTLFERLYEATESPNAALYIARCQRELGRHAEAYETMTRTLELAVEKAATDRRYAMTRDAAGTELTELRPKIALVVLVLAADAESAEVTVNGEVIPPADLGRPRAFAPGELEIVATAPGREFKKSIQVKGGSAHTVAVVLQAVQQEAEPTSQTPKERQATPRRKMSVLPWVAYGAGGLGFLTFAIAGSQAEAKYDELSSGCANEPRGCPLNEVNQGKTLDTIANVGLGLGVLGVVGGTVLLVMDSQSRSKATARRTEVQLTGTRLNVSVTF
jgi:hypothetical protein